MIFRNITLENSYEILEKEALKNLNNKYGEKAPDIIINRLNTELDFIKNQKSAFVFLLVQKIVNESEKMGYITGTRGTVR